MPTASIIVPVYNVAPYLPACLDSLRSIPLKDIEVLLVDDGSSDQSPDLLFACAGADPRFRVIRQPNFGLSGARNTGLEQARGEYLFFVDADDWIDPALIGDAVEAARRHGAEQVLWNYRYVYGAEPGPAQLPMGDAVLDLSGKGLRSYFYRYWFPYRHGQEAWARLYRRDVLLDHGLRFAPGAEIFAEDTLMSASYLLYTNTLVALQKPYVYYRQRPDGIMGAPKPRLAARLMALCARYVALAQASPRAQALRPVLPMFCYRLITKGLALDPDPQAALSAMTTYGNQPEIKAQLQALHTGSALPRYLLGTGKGLRTQWRGRAFAGRWLRGDVAGAFALVHREQA